MPTPKHTQGNPWETEACVSGTKNLYPLLLSSLTQWGFLHLYPSLFVLRASLSFLRCHLLCSPSSSPRLWCPWGPAEAPIKPAVNGSNPVINGCVLQTRVWGCCSHGFIRWNGIGTHAQIRTHSFTDVIEAAYMRASMHTLTPTYPHPRISLSHT